MDLDYPSAQRIKESAELILSYEERVKPYSEQPHPLNEALWICNHLFQEKGTKKEASRRIFLFTADDNPNGDNLDLQAQALNQAKQLSDQNVDIELFPLKIDNRAFDYKKFFIQIISFEEDEISSGMFNPQDRISELSVRLKKKEFKKRIVSRLDFRIGEGTIIGTKLYSLINKFKKPAGLKLDGETNKILSSVNQLVCKESKTQLYPSQIGYYVPLGGEKVEFTQGEMKRIKEFGEPELVLIGFKPIKALKPYHNIRSPYFIYPDNERVDNSSKFFHGLIEMLIKKKNGNY